LASGTTYYVRVKTNLVPEWGPTKNFSTTNGARIASDRSEIFEPDPNKLISFDVVIDENPFHQYLVDGSG